MMPYIIILKVRKFHQSTINRFGTAGKKPIGGLSPQLQTSLKGARISPIQNAWNKSISSVRVSVEWIFGDILNF